MNQFYLIRTNFREASISRFSRYVKSREINEGLAKIRIREN